MILACRQLHKAYGIDVILEKITFHIEEREKAAIVGVNGAGKTTLFKVLTGEISADGGEFYLKKDASLGYLAQNIQIDSDRTIYEEMLSVFEKIIQTETNLRELENEMGNLSGQALAEKMEEYATLQHYFEQNDGYSYQSRLRGVLKGLGFADNDFNRPMNQLSGGQKTRVHLAKLLLSKPDILLLDEPTSFLDVKGKIELLTILQKLAHEQGLAVIVSLHELDMAQKIADAVVCVFPHSVSGVLTPKEAFAPENIRALYSLTKEQYEAVFGPEKPAGPKFEHYVRSGQKLLRCGYTTGTCAALGAAGAARLLLTGHAPESVALRTPKGIVVEVAPLYCRPAGAGAECAIEKDGGDDVDVTTGLPVIAAVELLPDTTEIRISGGKGVGRVTKAGLDQPVGEAAINHVPRQMIAEALQREAESACYTGGFAVTISIEGGEEVAKRTFNPHIGVEGGLSVLGTSGIVEPMSQQAILDTIQLEMGQAALRAVSPRRLMTRE